MNLRRFAIAASLVATLMANSVPVWAQTNEQRAAARAAAEAGADAYDAGKYEEAADLFTRAERLLHAPPHLLFAARSYVKLGRLVEARELYLTLVREPLPADAPRVFRDAVSSGNKELDDIEGRIAYVSVVVQGSGSNEVRVTRDGRPVPSELVGVPHPVDPGKHEYQAFADGMESAPTSVQVKEGVRETVVLTLQEVPGGRKPPSDATGTASGSSSLTTPGTGQPQTDQSGGGTSGLRIGAYVSFGVAAVGAGLGTYFLISSNSERSKGDDLYADCLPRTCSEGEEDAIDAYDVSADDKRTLGAVSLVAGGVGLVTGITLLLVDSGSNSAASSGVRPVVGLNYAGLSGRF